MLQNTYFYIENVNAEFAHDPFQLIDLNNDGYQDFVFDLASPGVRNTISACFVYDARQGEFVFPGSFSTKKNVGYDEMWEDVDVEEWSGHEHRYESH